MQEKILVLDQIGQVTFRKYKQSKRVALKIKQSGEVLVTMPLSISYKHGLKFAQENKDWILKAQGKVNALKNDVLVTQTDHNEFDRFSVSFESWNKNSLMAQKRSKVLFVYYPESTNVEDVQVQTFVKKAVVASLRDEGLKYLPQRVNTLASQFGFSYRSLKVNKAKTRWGSCNRQKDINLSCFLMLLPSDLIDSVILHELCHTREMNHGPAFYALMDKVTHGKTITLQNRLKTEGKRWSFLKT